MQITIIALLPGQPFNVWPMRSKPGSQGDTADQVTIGPFQPEAQVARPRWPRLPSHRGTPAIAGPCHPFEHDALWVNMSQRGIGLHHH